MKHALILFLVLTSSLSSLACAPAWTVVRQTSPDPFVGRPQFSVEPLHFEDVTVGEKSGVEYSAGKHAESRESWRTDQEAMSERFTAGLAAEERGLQIGGPGTSNMVVRPVVTFVEPGFYAYVASQPTELAMSIQVLDVDGHLLDEIEIHSEIGATMINPSSGTRLRQAAEHLGKVAAKYLIGRVAPRG